MELNKDIVARPLDMKIKVISVTLTLVTSTPVLQPPAWFFMNSLLFLRAVCFNFLKVQGDGDVYSFFTL